MANPQPTDAHLRMAHSINEQVMVSDFTKRQRKILDLILRLSWGCGKKEAIIPRQKDFEIVGIYEADIKQELDWLVEAKVIVINSTSYHFNKDYDQWRVSRAKKYTQAKLGELLRLNLKGKQGNLVKYQVETLRNTKKALGKTLTPPDTNLATPKEILNKVLKKDNSSIDKDITIKNKVSPQKIWVEALELLKGKVNKANYNTWLSQTIGYSLEEGVFNIHVPSKQVAEYLNNNQQSLIENTLIAMLGEPMKVSFLWRTDE